MKKLVFIAIGLILALYIVSGLFYFQGKVRHPIARQLNFEEENVLEEPPEESRPIIRIFDRTTDRCYNTYETLKNELGDDFNINFECVPTENMDDVIVAAIYKYYISGFSEKEVVNITSMSYYIDDFEFSVSGENITGIEEPSNQVLNRSVEQSLKDTPLTLFFIPNFTWAMIGLPTKVDICEVADYEKC